MKALSLAAETHSLGAPANWDEEKMGTCDSLSVIVRDGVTYSAWRPSEEELALLNDGGVVVLTVASEGHPPVMLDVQPGKYLTKE